jgi:GntR family transcriptional regulator, transcriptional repressor for pyruvate dehydrogenase complex
MPVEKKKSVKAKAPKRAKGESGHAYLRVAEAIRLRIVTGQLKPGDRLPNEIDLSKEQGVGRTTVREALRLLASARLIETRRGVQGGAFITHPSAEDLDDLMMTALSLMTMNGELRDDELAEATNYTMPTVARIATHRGTDEEMDQLGALAASLLKTASDDEWVTVGREFNTLLVQMTRNRVFSLFIKPLMWISPTRYKEHRQQPGWREQTALRYQELADAVRRRAPAAAEEAMLRLRQSYVPYLRSDALEPASNIAPGGIKGG